MNILITIKELSRNRGLLVRVEKAQFAGTAKEAEMHDAIIKHMEYTLYQAGLECKAHGFISRGFKNYPSTPD